MEVARLDRGPRTPSHHPARPFDDLARAKGPLGRPPRTGRSRGGARGARGGPIRGGPRTRATPTRRGKRAPRPARARAAIARPTQQVHLSEYVRPPSCALSLSASARVPSALVYFCTYGSRSRKMQRGTCLPAPVSEKKVLKASSPPPMVLSEGIWPSGWMPCSRQNSSQQALPVWIPAWPMWMQMHSLSGCRGNAGAGSAGQRKGNRI